MVAAPFYLCLRHPLRPILRVAPGVSAGVSSFFLYQPIQAGPYALGVLEQPAHEVPYLPLYPFRPKLFRVGAPTAGPGVVPGSAAVVVEQGPDPGAGRVRPQGVSTLTAT